MYKHCCALSVGCTCNYKACSREFTPPGGLGDVPSVLNSLHLVALPLAMYVAAAALYSLTFCLFLRGLGHILVLSASGLGHVPSALNSLHLVAFATYFVAAASFSLTFCLCLRGLSHVPGALNSLHHSTW